MVQRSDRDRRRAALRPRRLGGGVAHVTKKSASAASVHRIELKREAVRVVEIDAVYRFALPKNRLSGSLHFRESPWNSVDIEILDSPAEVRTAGWLLPNAVGVPLRQRHIRWSVADSQDRLASAVVLKSMNRHSEDSPIPLDGAPQVGTPDTHMVQRADAYR